MQLSIFILVINQLDEQNLFYNNKFCAPSWLITKINKHIFFKAQVYCFPFKHKAGD